jgi:hypothetical protein
VTFYYDFALQGRRFALQCRRYIVVNKGVLGLWLVMVNLY